MRLRSKWGRALMRIAKIFGILYLGLLLLVFFGQRKLIYHPDKGQGGSRLAEERGFQAWQNEYGQYIGWKQLRKMPQSHGQILIVHGNSGSAVDRLDYADDLQKVEPLDVYILEYPGFGARDGSPSEKIFFRAADEAINLLKKQGPVYLMGESLGTGVAAYLAGTYPEAVQGVLLVAPYDNMTHVAQYHMPIFPVSLMLLDRFPSSSYFKNYHGPVAMLFAGRDGVVPNRFGHKLFEDYQGPKRFWEVPQVGHNDLLSQTDDWWRGLISFWKANPAPDEAAAPKKSAATK
ncbi:MAG: hypothetical protein JWQ04_719 [Pedosphaera sp.]|nr:hypothetical protein [Pedosphaera sp.]